MNNKMPAMGPPQSEKTLKLLFRKFAADKLHIREMKAKVKSKNPSSSALAELEELDMDAQNLQRLKNQYSFSDSKKARGLAQIFAQALEELEAKLASFKSRIKI